MSRMQTDSPLALEFAGMDVDEENVSVVMTGVVLASMQLEMMGNSECGDVAGYLRGHVRKTVKAKITDNEPDTHVTEHRIVITSYTVWHNRPYDRSGALDMSFCGRDGSIIGVFRFRRNTQLKLSLRETAFYESISSRPSLPAGSALPHHHVFAVFTSETKEASTVDFNFAFFRKSKFRMSGNRDPFLRVPVVISNLVESTQTNQESFVPSLSAFHSGPTNTISTLLNALSMRHIQEYNILLNNALGRLGFVV
ncbi:hypothetical protein BC829DRAFT_123280 [Chytridium lagenaria]|nr:hypothetical protein BC829DRAFT_123280 [Chytridium lagenaria]